MTRKYKLERLQKNILLGISGVTLASTIVFAGAQTATPIQNNDRDGIKTLHNLNKVDKEKINLCKKDALKIRQKSKLEAEKKYNENFKELKETRLKDLIATRTATTSTSTPKLINQERKEMRVAIEKKFQNSVRALKDIRHSEREKADEIYDNSVCQATTTPISR